MKAIVIIIGDIQQQHMLGRVNTLGSALDNTILIQDRMVSAHHAEIRMSPDGSYELIDLDSDYGTFVGKDRVTRHVLSEGEEFLLGITRLVFRPASAEDSSRRWAERYPCDLPVRVMLESGHTVDTRATVISLKGMAVELDPPPPPEALISVTITLPDTGQVLRTRARVAQVNPGSPGVGVAFLFDSEQTQAKLMEQLRLLILATER